MYKDTLFIDLACTTSVCFNKLSYYLLSNQMQKSLHTSSQSSSALVVRLLHAENRCIPGVTY